MDNKSFSLYLELRSKIQQYQTEIGFKCLRCDYGCCERNIERIPILPYDIKLMKREDIDLNGIRQFGSSGYSLRREATLNHCYYYNKPNQACRVHNCKPIYCLSFPFPFKFRAVHYLGRVINDYNELLFPNPYCTWIKQNEDYVSVENQSAEDIRRLIEQL